MDVERPRSKGPIHAFSMPQRLRKKERKGGKGREREKRNKHSRETNEKEKRFKQIVSAWNFYFVPSRRHHYMSGTQSRAAPFIPTEDSVSRHVL